MLCAMLCITFGICNIPYFFHMALLALGAVQPAVGQHGQRDLHIGSLGEHYSRE